MFKVAVLALFVVSCTCQQVIEVSGNRVVRKDVPLRIGGVVSQSVPVVGQTVVQSSPVVSSYGIGGLQSVNTNLAYLQDLRARVLGSPSFYGSAIGTLGGQYGVSGLNTVNIAPSVLSTGIPAFGQSYLSLRQPQHISIAQPSLAIAQRPAIHVAQPASYAVHQGTVAVARPQVYAGGLAVNHQQAVHPVNAAITQVARTVEYRPIPYQDQPIVPQEVVVEPSDQPINIHFRSRSSTVRISQEHIPGEPGQYEATRSEDEASRVQHEVVKPVVQEVKEVIQPYRQVTQEINPVVENVHTVVTHGEGQRAQYVAEPIVRQQLLSVRPAVQQVAVAQPAIQTLAVPRATVSVAQPIVQQFQQVRPVSYVAAQPAVSVVAAQPALAAYRGSVAVAQPQIYGGLSVSQPLVSSYSVGQPLIGAYGVRSVGIAQPVVGVNRVVSVNQPGAVVRSEVREVRPGQVVRETSGNYVRYAESD